MHVSNFFYKRIFPNWRGTFLGLMLFFSPFIWLHAQVIEQFKWELKVGIIKFGDAHYRIFKNMESGATQLKAEAEGTGFIKLLYNNRYSFEATMNPKTGFPIKNSYHLIEGKINLLNHIRYDYTTRTDSTIVWSELSGMQIIAKKSYDILTAFQQFRFNIITEKVLPGDTLIIKTYFTDEPWDLVSVYQGKETIETKLGKQECYVYKPQPELGNFFDDKDAVTFWISADKFRIPVKMQADLKIASVTATLVEYKNPSY